MLWGKNTIRRWLVWWQTNPLPVHALGGSGAVRAGRGESYKGAESREQSLTFSCCVWEGKQCKGKKKLLLHKPYQILGLDRELEALASHRFHVINSSKIMQTSLVISDYKPTSFPLICFTKSKQCPSKWCTIPQHLHIPLIECMYKKRTSCSSACSHRPHSNGRRSNTERRLKGTHLLSLPCFFFYFTTH